VASVRRAPEPIPYPPQGDIIRRLSDPGRPVARWLDEPEPAADDEPLAVVHPDDNLNRALDVLYAVLGAAHESKQHTTAADVLTAYCRRWSNASGLVCARLRSDIAVGLERVAQMPPAPVLQAEIRRLRDTGLVRPQQPA
jgi:hypothetical protein